MDPRRINENSDRMENVASQRRMYSCSATLLGSCEGNCLNFWLTIGFYNKFIALTGEYTNAGEFMILSEYSVYHFTAQILYCFISPEDETKSGGYTVLLKWKGEGLLFYSWSFGGGSGKIGVSSYPTIQIILLTQIFGFQVKDYVVASLKDVP